MIENLNIEKAGMDDAAEILDLQKLAYQSEAALYPGEPIPPLTQTLEEMKNDITGQLVLKAQKDRTVIGSVRGRLSESTCFIGRLIVHPDFQNRGIGTLLLRTLESRFPQAKRFELFTGHKSVRNLHLYEKLGYRVFRREKVSDSLTLVFLEKNAGIL
jgi:ribosomal protein S18 acetylase RimI-like enzyme